MLNITGRSTPYHMLIFIWSRPNVRKMPASIANNALKTKPA
ncbi:hypothetical protein ACQKNB_03635 [Lysinibacillus xylanilyticus]